MKIMDVLRKVKNVRLLPPRDVEFYNLLEKMSQILIEASGHLAELFNVSGSESHEEGIKIEACLAHSTQVAETLETLLKVSQQPPFDRSELSQFATLNLRVLRFMNHAANRYIVYEIPSSDKEMRELAPIIREASENIAQAVKSLRGKRNIEPFCRAVDHLETKADMIYHEGLRRRFHEIRIDGATLRDRIGSAPENPSPSELLSMIGANVNYTRHAAVFFILRQVYAELERAIDTCKDVTTTLKRMVAGNV